MGSKTHCSKLKIGSDRDLKGKLSSMLSIFFKTFKDTYIVFSIKEITVWLKKIIIHSAILDIRVHLRICGTSQQLVKLILKESLVVLIINQVFLFLV